MHTKTPWTYAAGGRYVREESTDGTIALMMEDDGHADKRARQLYDALVAALEYMLARAECLPPDDAGMLNVPRAHIHMRESMERARAALALAKGD